MRSGPISPELSAGAEDPFDEPPEDFVLGGAPVEPEPDLDTLEATVETNISDSIDDALTSITVATAAALTEPSTTSTSMVDPGNDLADDRGHLHRCNNNDHGGGDDYNGNADRKNKPRFQDHQY